MKVLFIVFCFYLGSLFFRQETLPKWLCTQIQHAFSGEYTIVHFDSLSFGFRQGIRIERLRVFALDRKDPLEPMLSADVVTVFPFSKQVKIIALKFPRLHDGYYEVGTVTEPLGENNGRFSLPRIPDFHLELIRPEVLGVAPERVTAAVTTTPTCLDISGIHLLWPDVDERMTLDGFCTIDLESMRVFGQVEGLARQSHIRPMLGDYNRAVTLDVPVALPYMDAFTDVKRPVPASCAWDVNLVDNEFTIRIRLKPELGRYNGVSLKDAMGGITLHVWWVDGKMQYETRIDVDSARDPFGRQLGGRLSVIGTNDVRVVSIDAQSGLEKEDILDIVGYLNTGMLDDFVCLTPPHVSVNGLLATYDYQQYLNDLYGQLRCDDVRISGCVVSNVAARFDYRGDTFTFRDISMIGKTGGRVRGKVGLSFPSYDEARAAYALDLDYSDGSVAEVCDIAGINPGRRHGTIYAQVHVGGSLFTNRIESLNGEGHVRVCDGHLTQMPLFAGLTELLAEKVPGIGTIVNQSDASCDVVVSNGVFHTDNLRIEGNLFSISGEGYYDAVHDDLNLVVQVRLMKDDSLPGLKELVRVLSWPFSKLLMEYRATGSFRQPKWRYVSILDRVL